MMTLLFALAVLPGFGLLYFVWKHDRLEKEPTKLLVMLFLFGMLCAPIAGVMEAVALGVLGNILDFSTIIGGIVEFLLVVAIAEEGVKFIFLQTVSRNDAFDCTFDGIVYAVCVGLGFAVLENVLYVFGSATESLTAGMATGVLRSVTAVPMHCCCAIYMGFFFGQQKLHEAQGDRALASKDQLYSLLVPILMHGFYDFGVSSEYPFVIQVTFGLMITMYVLAYYRVRTSSAGDTRFRFPTQAQMAYAGQVVNNMVPPASYQAVSGEPMPYAQQFGQMQRGVQGAQPFMPTPQQMPQPVMPTSQQQAPQMPQQVMRSPQQVPQGTHPVPQQAQQTAQATAWAPQPTPQAQQPYQQVPQPGMWPQQQAPQIPQQVMGAPQRVPQAPQQAPQAQQAHQATAWVPQPTPQAQPYQQAPQGTGQVPPARQAPIGAWPAAGAAEDVRQNTPLPPEGHTDR